MPLPPAQHGQQGPGNRLHDAAYSGSVERTAALLSSGLIDIDEGGRGGRTPLMLAAEGGYLPIATILLNRDANVSIVNDSGFTALLIATQHGHLAVTKMLMKAGADIETATPEGCTPLHFAAGNGHSEVMRALIQAGANPNSRMLNGATPLFHAAQEGYVDVIRELLRVEANPLMTIQSDTKWLPLHAAVQYGHSEVVRELILQVGIEGCCGKSDAAVEALCLAARHQHVDTMAMLMEAGVIDTGDCLVVAASYGPEESVKLLLQHKKNGESAGGSAYVNCGDSVIGVTPLLSCIVCCQSHSRRVARLLVDAGADTISKVQITSGSGGNDVLCDQGTPLSFTNRLLREKRIMGRPATEEQLHSLEAIRRLLLQVDAVHAVSWLWPSGIAFIVHAVEGKIMTETTSTPLTVMLPILRRRARRRGVLLSALFRYSSKPEPGSTREVWGALGRATERR